MSEAAPSRLDSLKWIVVLALVAGGVFGNSYYGDQPAGHRSNCCRIRRQPPRPVRLSISANQACSVRLHSCSVSMPIRITDRYRPYLPPHPTRLRWQARRESNPQPADLESAALPIELLAFHSFHTSCLCRKRPACQRRRSRTAKKAVRLICQAALELPLFNQSRILATTPAPTVRPPSRIAKRRPSSIAIGAINSATKLMLSPGITISTPSGSSTAPVTSVVRK